MTEITDAKSTTKIDGKAKPAPRTEHVLKAPLIQQGKEIPVGKKVWLKAGQVERLQAAGTI